MLRTYPYLLSLIFTAESELSLKVRAPWPPQRKGTRETELTECVGKLSNPGELVRPPAEP